jgi:hypothetical protein
MLVSRQGAGHAQSVADLLRDISPAVIERVGNILHKQRERPERCHITYIVVIELASWIMFEGFRMLIDLPQLWSSDTSESLAGRSPDKNIDCIFDRSKAQLAGKLLGRYLRNVPRSAVQF